jgi:polysaccharide export outer membrane protein
MSRKLLILQMILVFVLPVSMPFAIEDCLAQQSATAQANLSPAMPNSVSPAVLGAGKASELTIWSGDLLEISVLGSAGFDQQVRVGSTGDVELPFIGDVQISGLTPEDAQKLIRDKLIQDGFYNNPQVSVFVKEYAAGGTYVLGEVQKPGFYPLTNIRRLFEALSIAGGTTSTAGRTVTITNPNHPERSIAVTLSNEPGDSPQENPEIMAGDTIIVSKAGIVYVVGDVRLPSGVVMNRGGLTILQAIAMAQGTNPTAALSGAKLIRRTASGPQEIPCSIKKILAARAPDIPLQPDDIVFIPSSAAKSAARRGIEAALQTATGLAIFGRY